VRRILHLIRRFWFSLWPKAPSEADDRWARGLLSDPEQELWWRMSPQDRRHAAAVARRVESDLGEGATSTVLVTALMHDVGKTVAGLGTYGRVL
jgi:hypothetical protein